MAAKSTQKRWTYAEFARLPESGSTRYEIIDDELYVTPGPGRRHQQIVIRLASALHVFAESTGVGEVYVSPFDVLFGEGDYVEPDILFVRKERTEVVTERGIDGAPDLVVEVLSPSTESRDRGIKLERYRHFGVPECWIVDPEGQTIEVWKAGEATPVLIGVADVFRWRPVPGGVELEIPLAELFGDR